MNFFSPTLNDAELDRRLLRDGFVVFPLLSAADAADLRTNFGELKGWEGDGFRSDLVDEDREYRAAADDLLQTHDASVAAAFANRKVFLRSFLCKHPGPDSELYLHRDWMYVDERIGHRTYAAWIALEDITGHNGQLQVLRGSHELGRDLRGTNLIPDWIEAEDVLRPRLATVPVPVGHCVVFDNALVHCSLPNNTETPRLAVAFALRSTEEPLVHFRRGVDGIQRYDIDPSFFLDHTPADLVSEPPAELPTAEHISETGSELGAEELVRLLSRDPLARLDHLRSRATLASESARSKVTRITVASRDQLHQRVRRVGVLSRERCNDLPSRLANRVLAANEAAINRFGPESPAVWDPYAFGWAANVEAAYSDIRMEVDELLNGPRDIPHIEDVVGGIPQGNVGPWRTFVLMHQGDWIPWNMRRCPRTTAVVQRIPGLTMAGFSVLEPGTHITEHRGPNKGALRYQLGVKVPGEPGGCRIRVGDETIVWREGESVVFDFTVPHEAWNDTGEIRVLLMLEFVTPLPWYLVPTNRLAQRAMRWFPTTRNVASRLQKLEPSLVRDARPAAVGPA